jgi:hypothetical protein
VDPGEFKMPVLEDVTNQPAESANQETFRVLDGKRPGAKADVSSLYPAAFVSRSAHPGEDYSFDMEQYEAEDKFGWARGVLWAIIFEAALVVGAVLVWKFHFFSH